MVAKQKLKRIKLIIREVKWIHTQYHRVKPILLVDPYLGFNKQQRSEISIRNIGEWIEKGLRIGDKISVEIDSTSLGTILRVFKGRPKGLPILYPSICPHCEGELIRGIHGGAPTCPNPDCIENKFHDLKTFAKTVGIPYQRITERSIRQILKDYPNCDVDIFYRLSHSYWLSLRKTVTIETLRMQSVVRDTLYSCDLYHLLKALNCPYAIPKHQELIEDLFDTVEDFYIACFQAPSKQPWLVPYYRKRMRIWFNDKVIQRKIDKLYQVGFVVAKSPFTLT